LHVRTLRGNDARRDVHRSCHVWIPLKRIDYSGAPSRMPWSHSTAGARSRDVPFPTQPSTRVCRVRAARITLEQSSEHGGGFKRSNATSRLWESGCTDPLAMRRPSPARSPTPHRSAVACQGDGTT
jgi:hypothetical protein